MSDIKNFLKSKQKIKLFHGTNRKFDKHCELKNRTILNDKYQGDWICYTDDINVAWKYTHAARNQNFDKELFLIDTKKFLNQYKELGKDLLTLTNMLLEEGYDCWDKFFNHYSEKHNLTEEKTPKNFFDKVKELEQSSEFNLDEFIDVLAEVENSKLSDATDNINIFSFSTPQLSQSSITFLEKFNFNACIPENRVIFSEISYNNCLKTSDREEAKNAKKNGYDLVIYSGEDCVDDKPEYLILDTKQINIKNILIENVEIKYLNESKSEWTENKTYTSHNNKIKIS
jgi:hypothetical protein